MTRPLDCCCCAFLTPAGSWVGKETRNEIISNKKPLSVCPCTRDNYPIGINFQELNLTANIYLLVLREEKMLNL